MLSNPTSTVTKLECQGISSICRFVDHFKRLHLLSQPCKSLKQSTSSNLFSSAENTCEMKKLQNAYFLLQPSIILTPSLGYICALQNRT